MAQETVSAPRLRDSELPRWPRRTVPARMRSASLGAAVALFDGYGLHRIASGDDQGFEAALMALWAAATRATGTR